MKRMKVITSTWGEIEVGTGTFARSCQYPVFHLQKIVESPKILKWKMNRKHDPNRVPLSHLKDICPECGNVLSINADEIDLIESKGRYTIKEPPVKCERCGYRRLPEIPRPTFSGASVTSIEHFLAWSEKEHNCWEGYHKNAAAQWLAWRALDKKEQGNRALARYVLGMLDFYVTTDFERMRVDARQALDLNHSADKKPKFRLFIKMVEWFIERSAFWKETIDDTELASDKGKQQLLASLTKIKDELANDTNHDSESLVWRWDLIIVLDRLFFKALDFEPGFLEVLLVYENNFDDMGSYDCSAFEVPDEWNPADAVKLPDLIISRCIAGTYWGSVGHDLSGGFVTQAISILELWSKLEFSTNSSQFESGTEKALFFGFEEELYSVDHIVHCILDAVTAILAKEYPDHEVIESYLLSENLYRADHNLPRISDIFDARLTNESHDHEAINSCLYLSKQLAAVLRIAGNHVSEQTLEHLKKYVTIARLLEGLYKDRFSAIRDHKIKEHFKQFEDSRQLNDVLKDYIDILTTPHPPTRSWYDKLLRPIDSNQNRYIDRNGRTGLSFRVCEQIKQFIVERGREVALEYQCGDIRKTTSMRELIIRTWPDIEAKQFREKIDELKDLGHDQLCRFIDEYVESDYSTELMNSVWIAKLLGDLEKRLRRIVLALLGDEYQGKGWEKNYNHLAAAKIRQKEHHRWMRALMKPPIPDSSMDFTTFPEVWDFLINAKDPDGNNRFPPLEVPQVERDRSFSRLSLVRNSWAHQRPLDGAYYILIEEYRKVSAWLDVYEAENGISDKSLDTHLNS
jgi:rRNA maturation protein Nop10